MDINMAKVVRYDRTDGQAVSIFYYEIAGSSLEAKPTENVAEGSIFIETDTGLVFMFSATESHWYPRINLNV